MQILAVSIELSFTGCSNPLKLSKEKGTSYLLFYKETIPNAHNMSS